MSPRRAIGPIIGIAVSILFLGLALYRVDLNAIGTALAFADYRLVALSAVFTFLSYILRTARWQRFLRPQKKISFSRLYPILIVGFALNNFLPGRPGEIARAFSLGQREGLPKTLGLATVVVERVVDGITLIAFLAFISIKFDLPGWGRQVEVLSIAIFTVGLFGLMFLQLREQIAIRLIHSVLRLVPIAIRHRVAKMLSSFILGLHSLRSGRDIVQITSLSIIIWLCEAAHYFVILAAFGLVEDPWTRVMAAGFTMVVVNLGISIPAAPGGVGPFEAAGVLALSAFGLAREQALPAILAAHTVQYLLVSGLGILLTAHQGVKLTQALDQAEVEQS